MHRFVFLSLATLLWTACGNDDGDDNETPAPLSVGIQPADGIKDVSVLTAMRVTLNYPLTSAVSAATASLVWDRGFNEAMTAGLSVDGALSAADRVVTFTPAAPLVPGMTYKFTISGLVTAAGAVPAKSVRFTTWTNPIARTINYSAAGTVQRYTAYTYDAEGTQTASIQYSGPGGDTVWFNGDDAQSATTQYVEFQEGHWTKSHYYSNAGADTQWGTADDVLGYHQLRTFDEHGQNTIYDSLSSLGADNLPFTGDETYSFRRHSIYDERGLMTRHTFITGAGNDGEWFTGDDAANGYSRFEYDAAGRRTAASFFGPGPDGLLYTADDEEAGYTEYTFSADGRRQTEVGYGDPGLDGLWHTADDVLSDSGAFEYDAAGLLMAETWRNDVDAITYYEEFDHDATGRRIAQRRYKPGADGVYLTGDDFVEIESQFVTP